MTSLTRRAALGGLAGVMGTAAFSAGKFSVSCDTAVPIEKFGAKRVVANDPGRAFDNAAALESALASGEMLAFDGYYFCSRPLTVTNRDLTLRGASSSGVVFASGGLSISQDQYQHQTTIEGLELITLGRETATGLRIAYSQADSIGNRTLPRCFVSRLTLRGWNGEQHGWRDGLVLQNVHSPIVRDSWVIGRRDLSAQGRQSFGTMTSGIRLTSSSGMTSVPSDSALNNLYVYNAQVGIACDGEFEGTSMSGCKLVGVWTGLLLDNRSDRPGLQAHDNHINCFDVGINVAHTPQAQIHDNLIYKFEQASGRTVGIRLDKCDLSHVGENTFINSCTDDVVSGDWDAVEIIDSGDCKIDAQIAERVNRIIVLSGGTTATEIDRQAIRGRYAHAGPTEAIADHSRGRNSF